MDCWNLETFGTDNDPVRGRSAPLEGHVSSPPGHAFAFDGTTGILPEHRNDIGAWTASIQQNVTWWKDEDAPTVVVPR